MMPLTDRELDVMAVLWDRGAATVADVRDQLADDLAYTTVLTVLRTLEAKGHVGHEVEGRAHLYFPRTVRRDAARQTVDHLIDKVFQGSADLLFARVLSDRQLSAEQLRRIRDDIDRRLGDHLERRLGKS
ncbi:MAG TPA: BlaI/MecI/CopY family transcriptional regulator [Thermoanaerobaculia bacterium]